MPNWCENKLIVRGSCADITAFVKKAKLTEDGSDFCFEAFIPMPKELREAKTGFTTIDGKEFEVWREVNGKNVGYTPKDLAALRKKYGYTNWYERNIAVIGTKWDVSGNLVSQRDTCVIYNFDSAWGPPDEGVKAISALYPDMTFELSWGGYEMGGATGSTKYKNGDIMKVVRVQDNEEYEDEE